jgi:LuxR family maltose regulon positive regulatory protein
VTARGHNSGNAARRLALVESAAEIGLSAPALLETKLYAPRARPETVLRPELVARIREGIQSRLTVVSAPAGFGKTTLLSEWLGEEALREHRPAWVSLDPSDNEPLVFWTYVVAALRRAVPGLDLAAPAGDRPLAATVTDIINAVAAAGAETLLVLDDYHVVQTQAIHDSLELLLDRMPARMHVVLASRSDPPLSLSRLRARGELTELRAADLRFSREQAAAFLNEGMGLGLALDDVAKLEDRTEGWVAALKLAALSLKNGRDVRQFVDAFSGHDRHIADYLVDEVLRAQTDRIRRFLLSTSILDRISGPLADAVTGERDSSALLEDLDRSNLFLVPLDDRREWYRYHHLFADVLQTHAQREDPARLVAAHANASVWHERHGSRSQAVGHAIGAGDLERAASLLEQEWPAMNRSYQSTRWLELVKTLPDALVKSRPMLSMGYAWGLLNCGELEAAAARLRDVEGWVTQAQDSTTDATESVLDRERSVGLASELAVARAYLTQALGESTVEEARQALDLTPDDDLPGRTKGTALLALAQWAAGGLDAAHATFSVALDLMRSLGAMLDVTRGMFVLGDLRFAQGRLREARSAYERGLEVASAVVDHGSAPETDELYLGLSELHIEWNELDRADELLARVAGRAELGEHRGNRERWWSATAAVRAARGDLSGASAALDEAEQAYVRLPLPRPRPIGATRARLRVRQGRVGEARSWADARGLSTADPITYLTEYESLTLARVRIAEAESGSLDDTLDLLGRIAAAAEAGGRTATRIEALILEAIARAASQDVRGALGPLGRALELAEPEGFLRIFLDEGAPMRALLVQATARNLAPGPVRRVLSGFDGVESTTPAVAAQAREDSGPLTPRELVILRLIEAGLRNQEIAKQLFISPATVKRHIANAYAKLGAGHRTEALVRAKELNLL